MWNSFISLLPPKNSQGLTDSQKNYQRTFKEQLILILFQIVADYRKEKKASSFFPAVIKTSMHNPKNIAQKENYQPIKFMNTNKQISYKTLLCNSKHVERNILWSSRVYFRDARSIRYLEIYSYNSLYYSDSR